MSATSSYAADAANAVGETERTVRRKTRIGEQLAEVAERLQGTSDPRQWGKALTGRYAGLWRYRLGDYRLVCQLQDARLVVLVVKVARRDKVYRGNP